ncbi:MAG: hypothetical protein U9P68_00905 [Pseudomonadota bacterium]|nr:hypothetical protein [Pseudomonadota bacterium]
MRRLGRHIPLAVLALTLAAAAPALAGGGGGGGGNASQGEETRRRMITPSETYMPLPPLTATVQANHRARGLLQIEAGLEIDDPQLRRRAERYLPRLRNAWVSALSAYTGMGYRFGDIPDADRISEILQEATDMTLGQEGAEVLIGMVIIHAD